MRRSAWGAVFVTVTVVAASACGAAAPSRPLSLNARVLSRGEFRGYTPGAQRSARSPSAYLAGDSGLTPAEHAAWIARLKSEGFKDDLTEFLSDAQGAQTGLSAVMQLGSAGSAQAELAAERRFWQRQHATPFPVTTIPGAVGYGFISTARGGQNVLFADGQFLYLEGYGWYGTAHNPKQSALIHVATELYDRVHGHPAG